MGNIPYKSNEELMAMKEDIADRKFKVRMIGVLVTSALVVGAIAAAFFLPGAASAVAGAGSGGVNAVLSLVMGAGAGITSLLTMKEVKRLEMDEKYIQTYMQGKNYWGEGYREEVAEKGYSMSGSPFPKGAPPPPQQQRDR